MCMLLTFPSALRPNPAHKQIFSSRNNQACSCFFLSNGSSAGGETLSFLSRSHKNTQLHNMWPNHNRTSNRQCCGLKSGETSVLSCLSLAFSLNLERCTFAKEKKKKTILLLDWGWDPSQSQAGHFHQVTQKSRILAETIQPAEGKVEQTWFSWSQSLIKKVLSTSKSQHLTCIFFFKFNSFPFSAVN